MHRRMDGMYSEPGPVDEDWHRSLYTCMRAQTDSRKRHGAPGEAYSRAVSISMLILSFATMLRFRTGVLNSAL